MKWIFALALTAVLCTASVAQADDEHGSRQPNFGPNVLVFDSSMPTSQIQSTVDAIHTQQVDAEFGDGRFAFLFKPGVYGTPTAPLNIQVGYYTSVAGLGASPDDVTINGTINVLNRCPPVGDCNALTNFWRSVDNLHVIVPNGETEFWATSQAAPLRRVHMTGNLFLFDFHSANQFSSGGFIADSLSDGGVIINGSQQQFMTRNSQIGLWTNGVWNQVFSGVIGAPPQSFGSTPFNPPPFTTLATSPITREKPYLQVDSNGRYSVFVPAVQHDSSGTTWSNGPTQGTAIPIERFFIASPGDSAQTINDALEDGKNLLLTPGIYHLRDAIRIHRPDTVVLGLGLPTLIPDRGDAAISVEDARGVDIAGVLFQAGPINSRVLLDLGGGHSDRVSALHDVFFRIGGAAEGRATNSLVVNSDNVILDDIWAWRADHGAGVGWTNNTADTGVVVNGDNVTAYGLFVEHYQKFEVVWRGENGRTIMFQNEMPYDPPDQASWSHDATLGWASFKVADSVRHFDGWGLGSYCFFRVNPSIHASHALEVPVRSGVTLHDILTVSLGGLGVIDHVVNDFGGAAQGAATIPVNVITYPPA